MQMRLRPEAETPETFDNNIITDVTCFSKLGASSHQMGEGLINNPLGLHFSKPTTRRIISSSQKRSQLNFNFLIGRRRQGERRKKTLLIRALLCNGSGQRPVPLGKNLAETKWQELGGQAADSGVRAPGH